MTDFSFGPYHLKRQARLLEGPEGPIEFSARAFDLLCALLDHPGEVVSKDALFTAVWPGVVVEENTLQVHISALRKALPDGMIATVHGRGYRYAGPAPEHSGAAAHPGKMQKDPLIAVLPFANLGGDPNQQYFSDGISQDITDRLTRFRELPVVAVDATLAGQGPVPDFSTIRAAMDADFVISGSVRRSASRIRIAVRLTDASTRASVWAEQYDRPLADIFDVQDEVADMVAVTISQRLEIELASRTLRKPASSLKSYELTLLGRWHYLEYTREGCDMAVDCLERALAEDPDYPEALLWLGLSRCLRYEIDFDLDATREGLDLIERVVKAYPTDSRPLVAYSIGVGWIHGPGKSRSAIELALRLNPNDYYGIAQRAMVAIYDGQIDMAKDWLFSLNKLTPHALPWVETYIAMIAFHEGRYREAIPGFASDDFAWHSSYLIACYGHLGETGQAQAIIARFAAQGRVPDFRAGVALEPYRDVSLHQHLIDGVGLALK